MEEQSMLLFLQRIQMYDVNMFVNFQWNVANWILYFRNPFFYHRTFRHINFGFRLIMIHIEFTISFPEEYPASFGMEIPIADLQPTSIPLFDGFPDNKPLYKDSGLWQMRSDDMEEVLVDQGMNEGFIDFILRCKDHDKPETENKTE